MLIRVLSQGYTVQLTTIHEQRLGMMGLRDHWLPGDLLLGSPFLREQDVFEGVPSGMNCISLLLRGIAAPGPFYLEFWPELHSAPNLVLCLPQLKVLIYAEWIRLMHSLT